MTTALVFDLILLVTVVSWGVLSAAILTERARHDRRRRRLAALSQALLATGEDALGQLASDVSVSDFDQLVVDGLPLDVETALARAVLADGRRDRLTQAMLGVSTGDVWKRIRAARLLTSARADGIHDGLDQMLRSGDRVLAAAALRFFIQLDDRRSAELMIQALLDGVHSRSRIAAAFNAQRVERAEALAPLFASGEASCRYWAARLARFLGTRRWVSRVRELTTDLDPYVRRAAVEAVGSLGDVGDVPIALELFSDPAPVVRAYAARAVAALGGGRHEAALRQLLNDSAWIVRAAAAEVLSDRRPVAQGDAAPAA